MIFRQLEKLILKVRKPIPFHIYNTIQVMLKLETFSFIIGNRSCGIINDNVFSIDKFLTVCGSLNQSL